jgi:hypothetical protein
MALRYFAELDENNIVIDVRVVTPEFMAENPDRYTGRYVETFIDNPNKQYAGIKYEYLENEDDFRPQQPFPSWTWLNKVWIPPTPMPLDDNSYEWSEEDLEWVAV